MSFLTDDQWHKVGAIISATPGVKEIVVKKDAFGNADVNFCGKECFKHKHLPGNVIQFPVDRMAPPPARILDRILDGIAEFMQDVYLDLGTFLGFVEDEGEEVGQNVSRR